MSCPYLLSNNNYDINTTVNVENNISNFISAITNVLNCAQKIIPEQGEVVVFEKPKFDASGKVYFYKINSNNTPGVYDYNYNIEFKSIIIGPYTTFFFRPGLDDKILPLNDHIKLGYNEKNVYFATMKGASEQLPETPNKYYELNDKGTYKSCKVSMGDCYTLCDDASLRTSKGASCLNNFRKCVNEKKGTSDASIISTSILTECSRKFLICQKSKDATFPFSTDFDKDYSKMCNPDPKKNNYQPLDSSCTADGITNAFQNLFYYGTFYDLCSSNECKITCNDSNWQQAWSEKKILEEKVEDKNRIVSDLQTEINTLNTDYQNAKIKRDKELSEVLKRSLTIENEYNDYILNMVQKKEFVLKELQIILDNEKDKHETNISELKTSLERLKNNDIILLNTQFLLREEDYKSRMNDIIISTKNAKIQDEINREETLTHYNNLQNTSEKIIKETQYGIEESLNKNLKNMNEQNIKDIERINSLHNNLLEQAIKDADDKISKINDSINEEKNKYILFKNEMEQKRKAIELAAENTDILYEKEIDRLNDILTLNNENNKKTIKNTQLRYENEISNLLKLSDAEKKIIILDKNVTIENKMDFLSGKKDLISQDFENKKKIINAEYEMAINAQENYYKNQVYSLKQENNNIINNLINVTNNYRNTISETQQNLVNLQNTQKERRDKLDNDIKIIQEEGEEKLKLIISEHEDNKIKLLRDSEIKTLNLLAKIDDKITEKEYLLKESQAYYELKIEKILSESKDKRIELIKNNTKELEVSISNLEKEYKNKSKELDIKIEELIKERNILQEESNSKLDNLNTIIEEKKEYKNVYVKSQYKTFSIGILIIINIILVILKLKK
jgi:hypothetical protein